MDQNEQINISKIQKSIVLNGINVASGSNDDLGSRVNSNEKLINVQSLSNDNN